MTLPDPDKAAKVLAYFALVCQFIALLGISFGVHMTTTLGKAAMGMLILFVLRESTLWVNLIEERFHGSPSA